MHLHTNLCAGLTSALLLLTASRAFASNDLTQPPTSAVYWHQDSAGMVIPGYVGGDEPSDHFGSAVASGDFNGDGYDDLAMGAPGENISFGPQVSQNAGAIMILYGGPSGFDAEDSATLPGGAADDKLGDALAAGDIDGDGYDDLVAGVSHANDDGLADAGEIAIAFGSPSGLSFITVFMDQNSPEINNNSEANDRFGASVSVGDVNSDGYADVAVGAPGESFGGSGLNSGAVYLLFGADDGLQGSTAPRSYEVIVESDGNLAYASVEGNQYGYSVLLHDLDGDSNDDLIVGAPFSDVQQTDAGLVYSHPSDGVQIVTAGTDYFLPEDFEATNYAYGFFFGGSLSGSIGPQVHSQSLLIGATGYDKGVEFEIGYGRGYLYVDSSPFDAYVTVSQQAPEQPEQGDQHGWAVLFADLDGDGFANERIIGAPGEDNGTGMIQLSGGALGHSSLPLREGDPGIGGFAEIEDSFGEVLASGNFNGRDGEELVVGIPKEDTSIVGAGMVLVLSWDPDDVIFANGFEGSGP